MAIIPLPSRFGFSSIPNFTLSRASNEVRSKYTAVRQILVYPYAIWQLDGDIIELDGKDAANMRSFLIQLEGKQNKFRLPVPGYFRPSTGYQGNATMLNLASPRDSSFIMTGLTPNAPILGNGDYLSVNDELKMSTSDIAADNNGRCLVSFKPALRKSVAPGVTVVLQNPTVLMNSRDDDVASWSLKPPFRQTSKFRAIEAIEL